MIEKLRKILPIDRITTRLIDLVSFAPDAGFYHLVPKAVVQPDTGQEIISLFRFSKEKQVITVGVSKNQKITA